MSALRLLSLLLAGLLAAAPPVRAERRERSVGAWRPVHFDVALTLPEGLAELASAQTEVSIEALENGLSTIDLDFGELPVDAVTVDGRAGRFRRRPGLLLVAVDPPAPRGRRLSVAVSYHGRPKDGLILAKDKDGRPSAVADNWPDRVHHWIPCLDHPSAKATVRFTVTAPERDVVVANGALESSGAVQAARAWTYSEAAPIPPYCMLVAVGEDETVPADAPAITPLTYYVPRSLRGYAARGFSAAAPALEFYRRTIAPYPYEKLALIVGASGFSGMEFPGAIVFPARLFDRKEGEPTSAKLGIPSRLEEAVAHEIAHQWFGDSVTEATWADLWLSEGFATYFAGLFLEQAEGEGAFRAYMREAAARYLAYEKKRRTPIRDASTQNLAALLNPNNYEKGAWVLHMLRKRLGDDAFFGGVRAYYAAHRGANAATDDLREALEQASGADLKEFFARWVYGTGHPVYGLSSTWEAANAGGGALTIALRQLQPGEPFADPVDVDVITASGKTRVTLRPSGGSATRRLTLPEEPVTVRLSPDNAVLYELAPPSP